MENYKHRKAMVTFMGWNDYNNGAKTTQYAEFDDGTVLCQRHFNSKFPNAWNTMVVNRTVWGELFKFDLVEHPGTDTMAYCTRCQDALRIPNADKEGWTEAWANVGQLVGISVTIWILKRGGTGQAAMDNYPSNKPYPEFNLFESKEAFERQLRHQCYKILGHYHIKISEDTTKLWVRQLISNTYIIFEKALT